MVRENVIKVTEHFWRIEEDGVRSFLFEGKTRAMLVDTGFGTIDMRRIVAELTDKPVFLVNTHADGDHTGKNNDFEEIYMHPAEMDRYQQKGQLRPASALWEGEVIDLDYWQFEVILIPGHTPGSIALLERNKRMLIAGDTVQCGGIYMFGFGRNLDAYIASIERLIKLEDTFDTIWPSHAECPVKPDILESLRGGAKDLKAGKLKAQEAPHNMPCKAYDCGVAIFLYDK